MSGRLRRLGPYLPLGLGVGLVLLLAYREAAKPLGQTSTEDGSQEVWGSTTVGQTFVAPFAGLYRVDVFLSPNGHTETEDLVFHLRTAPDDTEDLRSATVNASTVRYGHWVTVEFAPIPDSGGKGYYFLLAALPSKSGDGPYVFRSRQDRYRDGTYYLNGAPANGDLAFLLYSRPGPIGWLRGLLGLLAQEKPSIWGQPMCYGALLVFYLVLLLLVVRSLAQPEAEDETPQDSR